MSTSRGTRRRVLLAGAATLALTPLTACGAGTQTAQPQDTGGPPVELLFMRPANQAATDAYNAQADAFNKKQTRYKGRFEAPALAQGETWETKLVTMIAGDSAPDVFLSGQETLPQFSSTGIIFNLDNHMKRDAKEVDANDFFPSHLGGGKWLGKQMALTADGCALLTYYNATLFQQANVPAPRPTWTWNDYLDAARRATIKDASGAVTSAGSIPAGGNNQFWLWLWSNGADLFSNDLKQVRVTEPAALEALQFVVDLTQRHGAAVTSPGVNV